MALLILSRAVAGLIADLHIGEAQGVYVAVLDAHLQLVEAVGGIADLQGQGLAAISSSLSRSSLNSSPLLTIRIRNATTCDSRILRSVENVFTDTRFGSNRLCK
jgi:hypothetical protein